METELFGLRGSHVIVTGASGGIGLATVRLFVKLGAKVSAQGNTNLKTLEEFGEDVYPIVADVRDDIAIQDFFMEATKKFEVPDVLVGLSPPLYWTEWCQFVTAFSKRRSSQLRRCRLSSFEKRLTSILQEHSCSFRNS
jgi:hypothetical protein